MLNLPANYLTRVVQTRSGMQSTHPSVASHDGEFQQNSVCKKGGVYDLQPHMALKSFLCSIPSPVFTQGQAIII